MEFMELAAGVYLMAITPFQSTVGTLNRFLFLMPLPVFGMFLTFDALSRVGLI